MKRKVTKFVFLDTDSSGKEEYDIRGDEYKRLIRFCCEHAAYLAVIATNPDSVLLEKFAPYEIEKPSCISYIYEHYGKAPIDVRYYAICTQLFVLITEHTNNIFSWINGWGYCNPEDPVFYRKDGSVLFDSVIHDGVCTLYIEEEDPSEIISDELWQRE